MSEETENTVKATERSFDIVEALRELDSVRLTVLSDSLDLPNSTVHNHLQTLMKLGYVVKEHNHYRLSLQFLDLGEHTRHLQKVYRVARPEIDELAEETKEVASLVVEEDGKGVVLYSAEGSEAFSLDTSPGTRIHLHASALGKAILAQISESEVQNIIAEYGLPAVTPATITEEESLNEELSTIRTVGIAIDDEERVRGSRTVAAPIRDEGGSVIGSIGVSGPARRLTEERMKGELADILHDTTNIIELKMAYS